MRIADSIGLAFSSANNDHSGSMWVSEKVQMDLKLSRTNNLHSTLREDRNYLF